MSRSPSDKGSQRGDRPTLPPIRDLFREELSGIPPHGPTESPSFSLSRLHVSDEDDISQQTNPDRVSGSLLGPGSQSGFPRSPPSSIDPRGPMIQSAFSQSYDPRDTGRQSFAQPSIPAPRHRLHGSSSQNPQPPSSAVHFRSRSFAESALEESSHRAATYTSGSRSYGAPELHSEDHPMEFLPSRQQHTGLSISHQQFESRTHRYVEEERTPISRHQLSEPNFRAYEHPSGPESSPMFRAPISTSISELDSRSHLLDDERTPTSGYRAAAPLGSDMLTQEATGSMPSSSKYECSYCGKGFNRPSSLKIHLNSHTGEKPFICPVESCGRSFSVLSNMRRHARVHAQTPLSQQEASSEEGSDRQSPPPVSSLTAEQESAEATSESIPASGWQPHSRRASNASSTSSRRSRSPSPQTESRPEKRTRHHGK